MASTCALPAPRRVAGACWLAMSGASGASDSRAVQRLGKEGRGYIGT